MLTQLNFESQNIFIASSSCSGRPRFQTKVSGAQCSGLRMSSFRQTCRQLVPAGPSRSQVYYHGSSEHRIFASSVDIE